MSENSSPELRFLPTGFLEPGVVELTPDQLHLSFCTTPARIGPFQSFDTAMQILRGFGAEVRDVFVNGSYISQFPDPSDLDMLIITKTEETALEINEQLWGLNLPGLDYNVYHELDASAGGFIEAYGLINTARFVGMKGQKGFVRLKHE